MVSKFAKHLAGNRKGQGLVEYGILAAGVALIALVSVTVLGHKTATMIGTLAALPGTEASDSGPVTAASLIETVNDGTQITLNPTAASTSIDSDRLDFNTGIATNGLGTATETLNLQGQSVLAVDPQ